MNSLREPILIRSLDRSGVGFLEYSGMHEPTWAHPRSEMYLFYFNLRLLGRPATRERFFTERYATTATGDYLAIEEYDTDGTPDSFDRVDVRLIIVSTARAEEAVASRQHHGSIRPVRIEADKVIYEKTRLDESGVIHHFDRPIIDLQWQPLQ
ncbi:hypothetical protein AYO49_06215 [Verrucomicrobiaceae bacterium SCGC AG-212-N21]|nr:hypothetical protein AYO49_06215 [Verrucomicrobiaceae bacterium SCGC AG-212-N21]